MLLTTTPTIEGAEIAEYFGIVTGEAILGANIFRDLFAAVRDIVGGRLEAGESLASEPELAASFGVSKVVVREMVQALAAQGLVRVQQGKRTEVLPESEWDVLAPTVQQAYRDEGRGAELTKQFYEARRVIEANSAASAADRASDDDLADLEKMITEMRDIATGSRELPSFLAVDRRFHDAIGRAAGNTVLRQVSRTIHRFLSDSWSRSKITEEELEALAEEHARIAQAIAERDRDKARKAMEEHIASAQRVEERA